MNKRGQFYLIAAIVVISLAAGFVSISNFVSSQQTHDVFYLRDEIKIESSRLIDYANYNSLTSDELNSNLADLAGRYINNSQDENFYFVFGDTTSMNFLAFQSSEATVKLDNTDKSSNIGTRKIYTESFTPSGDVTINLNGNDYIFKLNSGENFGFIVFGKRGGQTYIASG